MRTSPFDPCAGGASIDDAARRGRPITAVVASRNADRDPAGVVAWPEQARRVHTAAACACIGATAAVATAWPGLGQDAAPWSGAALLIGGALIGVPHGTSDFVVAARWLQPRLGRGWLPAFLTGYLALVALVLGAWWLAPVATLVAFLALSGFHFASGDVSARQGHPALAYLVRATTPLLPILLCHPAGVAPLIAALSGSSEGAVLHALRLAWPTLIPWSAAVAALLAWTCLRARAEPDAASDACEIAALATAAVVLPPLFTFGLYFCLVHAPRHLIEVATAYGGQDRRRAARLVALIVLPSAAVCSLALVITWDRIAGAYATSDLLVWALRLLAALTVPHMALEAWSSRARAPIRTRAAPAG